MGICARWKVDRIHPNFWYIDISKHKQYDYLIKVFMGDWSNQITCTSGVNGSVISYCSSYFNDTLCKEFSPRLKCLIYYNVNLLSFWFTIALYESNKILIDSFIQGYWETITNPVVHVNICNPIQLFTLISVTQNICSPWYLIHHSCSKYENRLPLGVSNQVTITTCNQ